MNQSKKLKKKLASAPFRPKARLAAVAWAKSEISNDKFIKHFTSGLKHEWSINEYMNAWINLKSKKENAEHSVPPEGSASRRGFNKKWIRNKFIKHVKYV
jgi:hypothetical protein